MAERVNPFTNTSSRTKLEGDFLREEMQLANRNSGIALEALRYDVTPAGLHYLLSHFDIPYIEPDDYRLAVTDLGGSKIELSLDDIKALPAQTQTVTMECAGNGRSRMTPRHPSMPWACEAVGTAQWTGTPLTGVLDMAGIGQDAHDVVFLGADRGFDVGIEHDYGRSLKLEHALSKDVLLVYEMNGAALLPQHGFPLRLIVPGWYGMASVKWLDRIEIIDRPYLGHQQTPSYHYRQHRDDPGEPVGEIRVKSLMVPPGIPDWFSRERLAEAGTVRLQGRAWSGGGVAIAGVEIGIDGEWHAALLGERPGPYAWTGWTFDWDAVAGEHELKCRATDMNGNVQPVLARYDHTGLGNNAVQIVQVTVR